MTQKREKFGCLSKSLEDFLYMTEDERFEKHRYDVNKYYQRIVKNVEHAISDLTFAYEKLPDEQKKKIDLLSELDIFTDYVSKQQLQGTPEKIILTTRKQLYAISQSYVLNKPIQKLAEEHFDKIDYWLDFLTPKRKEIGAPV